MAVQGNTSFGAWLKARRKALDLTQFDLAERVGCAESTIQRIEAGERRPSRQVGTLMAEALGIPPPHQEEFVLFARTEGAAPPPLHPTSQASAASASPTSPASAAPLPVPLMPLLGRDRELRTGYALLGGGQGRLLTLTGPPGVGKTRLALALAAEMSPDFPDGVCFVPLAPLRDPALFADYVARALGLQDSSGGPPGARLGTYLRAQHLLLVLDNFEHVVSAAPGVGDWLQAAPGVRVLATSRVALGLRGERRLPVPPLAVPPPDAAAQPEVLLSYPSVALFVQSAEAVDPEFLLSADNAGAVAALCNWLEGVPLALQLAAARSARLSPEEVRAGLPRRLDLSARGLRDVPAHQQTLRAALDWSYGLLAPNEQKLLRRMAVFAGGASVHALEAVCNAHGDVHAGVATAVEGLLDASLVQRTSQPEGGVRFSQLEMVREYAQEQLDAHRETEMICKLFAEYYLGLAEVADEKLYGPEQIPWLKRVETEHNNFRAVLTWAADRSEGEVSLRLAGALGRFWQLRGYWTEGRARLAGALAWEDGSPRARCRALIKLAALAGYQGDRQEAQRAANAALLIARSVGDERLAAHGFSVLMRMAGDEARRAALVEEATACYKQIGDRWGRALLLFELGYSAWLRCDWPQAEALTQQAVDLYRDVGDSRQVASALLNLGGIFHAQGLLDRARAYYMEGLPLLEAVGEPWGLGAVLSNLGFVATLQHDYSAAAEFYQRSLQFRRQLGGPVELGRLLILIGNLARETGDLHQAHGCFEESLAVFRDAGYSDTSEQARTGLALIALREGKVDQAEEYCRQALADATNRDAVPALGGLAGVAAHRGHYHRAACLAGALHALSREVSGDLVVDPDDYLDGPLLEEVRARLGEAKYTAAWAEGKALSWQEARALALG